MVIDRVSPTRRPPGKACGYQKWRSLLFTHWPVPVESLRPLVDPAFELDLYEGVAYVGVVPFAMETVRPSWLPPALAFNFLETNVRTYVVHNGKPGVVFFSLEAASWLAVFAARQFWGLPYYHADMQVQSEGDVVHYRTERRGSKHARHRVRYRVGEQLAPSKHGTIEFFLLERYLLFVERRGQIYSGQVHHTPYPAHAAEVLDIDDSLMAAAGIDGCEGPPLFAHYSSGVDVEIFPLNVERR